MMITTRRRLGFVAAGLFAGSAWPAVARAQAALPDGSTIVLVRHADKLSGDGDVALAPAGKTRAKALRDALRDAGISVIVTTTALRTRQTAMPLAERLGLAPIAVERSQVEQTVRSRLPAAVLVVGHSETVPELVRAFGGPDVAITGFDDLFVIIRANGTTQFIQTRYGALSA